MINERRLQPYKWLGYIRRMEYVDSHLSKLTESERQEYSTNLNRTLSFVPWFSFSIFAAACAINWTIVSLVWDLNAVSHLEFENWFSRSGAILTISAVFLELQAQRALVGFAINDWYELDRKLVTLASWSQNVGFGLLLIGSVIWAYGDKFLR